MRRSKIRATVCVGRRKPDSSRKAKESAETNNESINSNEMININELKSVQKDQSESTISSEFSTTSKKLITQATSSAPVSELSPNPTSSVDSVLPITTSDPKLLPPPVMEPIVHETIHTSLTTNASLKSRSKVKAVPKFWNRKTGSHGSPQIEILKIDCIKPPNETHNSDISSVQEISNSPANASSPVKSVPQIDPIPPTSPTKICRSKIKAVPVLANRKMLSNASDSEDGCKRSSSSRVRTESQCSNFSGIQDTTAEQPNTINKLEGSCEMKKKFRKSEGSKKLAEARREFAKKYVDGKPDYKKLTMMDLIFYNPTTNPMRYEKKKIESTEETKRTEEDVDDVEVVTDDPSNQNNEQMNNSDGEDEIIAPRIKIGPTGEIILDEKSLVIENKKVKKVQEAIEKSVAVDGDLDRPYGVYKKSKRSKDWSHSETMKFFRALNTVGTDFTLMTELFPKRTRRELKIKFKREEKANQALVDLAIMKPCNFDYEELKAEFELMDIETLEIEQQRMKDQELNKKKQNKKSSKFLNIVQECSDSKGNTHEVDGGSDLKELESVIEKPVKRRGRKPKLPKVPKRLDILSVLSESDSCDQESTDSEGDAVWQTTQTTRYGRKTKRREIYEANTPDPDEPLMITKKIRKANPEPEPAQKPGSIMMVSSETPEGQSVVKIFMVTDNKMADGNENGNTTKNLLPIVTIRTDNTDDEDVEEIVENNYTIPADIEVNLREHNMEETPKDLTEENQNN